MRGTGELMLLSRPLLLVGMLSCLASVSGAAEQSLKPLGVFPFAIPGSAASRDAQPRAFLWCQGATLVGVVVPDTKSVDCTVAGQKRAAPRALLLRDGRCEALGTAVSFGLLMSRKAWVFESAGRKPTPRERTVWLLLRFEGSVNTGQLTGALVQVDVNHPGLPFQRTSVEAEALAGEPQASFSDETAWRSGIAQTLCLAEDEP
jgi:hypothetical protein